VDKGGIVQGWEGDNLRALSSQIDGISLVNKGKWRGVFLKSGKKSGTVSVTGLKTIFPQQRGGEICGGEEGIEAARPDH